MCVAFFKGVRPINIHLCASTAAFIFLAGCAGTPPQPAAASPVLASSVAVQNPVPAAAASTPAAAPTDDDHVKSLAKSARELGYRVEKQQDARVYCHTEAKLGSRFAKKECLDEPSFEDVVRNVAITQATMRQSSGCSAANCIHN
jgi:hypothetical protein